jgi:hypothetical protein
LDDDEYKCCKESSIVVYQRGIAIAHCYRGTRECWEKAEADGYFRACNSSYWIVGATD